MSDYEDTDENYSSDEGDKFTLFDFVEVMTYDEKSGKNWKKLIRYPRINGINLERITGPSEGGRYENGIIILRDESEYEIIDITIENKEVKISSISKFNIDGKLVDGYVNYFSLGYMSIDEEYIQELFTGFINNKTKTDSIFWDKIK